MVRPKGLVPAAAHDPLARASVGHVAADTVLHFGERARTDQVDRELLLARLGHVGVRVVEAGHGEGASEVDDHRVRACQRQDVGILAYVCDRSPTDGKGRDATGRWIGVVLLQFNASEDIAVNKNGIGRSRLVRPGDTAREQQQPDAQQQAASGPATKRSVRPMRHKGECIRAASFLNVLY